MGQVPTGVAEKKLRLDVFQKPDCRGFPYMIIAIDVKAFDHRKNLWKRCPVSSSDVFSDHATYFREKKIFRKGAFIRLIGPLLEKLLNNRLKAGIGVSDFRHKIGTADHTPSSSLSACARASGVTSAPLSIRAISSCRPSASSRPTLVRVTVPSDDLAIR